MQFIYVLQLVSHYRQRANWTDDTYATISAHYNYLLGLNQKGIIKLVGKTDYEIDNDENMGLVIFDAESPDRAAEIMNNDPCLLNGVMTAKLHPFSLAMYAGKETNS